MDRRCIPCLAIVLGGVFAAIAFLMATCQARAHDIYTGISNLEGLSCCAGADCHYAFQSKAFVMRTDGGYILKQTKERIDEGQIGFSPDQNFHICRFDSAGGNSVRTWKAGDVRCLLVPPGGT